METKSDNSYKYKQDLFIRRRSINSMLHIPLPLRNAVTWLTISLLTIFHLFEPSYKAGWAG